MTGILALASTSLLYPHLFNHHHRHRHCHCCSKAGQYSSEDAVRAFIAQARRVEGCMRVIRDERFDAAIAEARVADALIREYRSSGRSLDALPPFLGVPATIKEVFAHPGLLQVRA